MAPGLERLGKGVAVAEGPNAQRELAITSAMQQLYATAREAQERVAHLIERLQPVLMPETPAPERDKTAVEQVVPPLADEIKGVIRILDNTVEAVNYTLNRLEI